MDLDSANNVYIVGYYKYVMQFEPNNPEMHLSSVGGDSFFNKVKF